MKPLFVVDEIGEVVTKVSTKMTPSLKDYDPLITGVHYEHGHPLEILETLAQKDKSDTYVFKKYPLIALFQDFTEDRNKDLGFQSNSPLHIIIARGTSQAYKAEERYAKNFKPVLVPIYLELLNQLGFSKAFSTGPISRLRHEYTERLFWGKDGLYGKEGNIFNDFIDCIELKINVKVNLKKC